MDEETKYVANEDGTITVSSLQEYPMKIGEKQVGGGKQEYKYTVPYDELEKNIEQRQITCDNLNNSLKTAKGKREALGKSVKMTPQLKSLKKQLESINRYGQQEKLDKEIEKLVKELTDQQFEIGKIEIAVDKAKDASGDGETTS